VANLRIALNGALSAANASLKGCLKKKLNFASRNRLKHAKIEASVVQPVKNTKNAGLIAVYNDRAKAEDITR
jgi:hypothetical protein